MKAAVYLRQSLDRHGNELAVTRQREDCLALCERRGWEAVEYVDNDTSATRGRRPAYQQLLADVQAGAVGAVVAWDADRLHRQPRELESFIDLADEVGLQLATVGGDFDLSTPTGRGNARMRGVFSRMEVEQKGWRQKRANQQRADKGQPWWPSRPFGYDAPPGPDGRWSSKAGVTPHPTEAAMVREAYADFLAGSSLRDIARRWNESGVTTPRGNRWTGSCVRQLLLSERNAGLRAYRGQVVGQGSWPAIVTEDTWRAAAQTLENPSRRNGVTRGRKYLLSGIARCGRDGCGHPLGSAISSRGQRQYACNHCQRLARDGVKLDELIEEAVIRRLSRDDAIHLLTPQHTVDTAALRDERSRLRDKLAQLGRDYATAPPEFTQAAVAEITARLDQIDAQLIDPGKARIFDGLVGVPDVRAAWKKLDLGRQRAVVAALLAITVLPVGKGTGAVFHADRVAIRWLQ